MYECSVCKKKHEDRREFTFTRDCHGIPFRFVCWDCYDEIMANGYDGEYYTELDENIDEGY